MNNHGTPGKLHYWNVFGLKLPLSCERGQIKHHQYSYHLTLQLDEATQVLLAMSSQAEQQFEGDIPFPAYVGDLDLDVNSNAGFTQVHTTVGDECGGPSAPVGTQVNSSATPAMQSVPHVAGNNNAAPRRQQPARGKKNNAQDKADGINERNTLLAELKKSFDNLQAAKKNTSFNERWGALLGIQINAFTLKQQEDFRFYVQCLAIAVRRGSITLPAAHHVLRGNWALEITMDSDSEEGQ